MKEQVRKEGETAGKGQVMSDKTGVTATSKRGAQTNNKLAKSGRQWEDEFARGASTVPGLRLGHFGAPTRVLGSGKTAAGRPAPIVVFEGPAPLDFCGHYVGRHCEIDCKRMTHDRPSWPFASAMASDQIRRADDLDRERCMVGIALLCDVAGKCYGIPWRFLMLRARLGMSSVTLADLDQSVAAGKVIDLMPKGSLYVRPFITMLHEMAMEVG